MDAEEIHLKYTTSIKRQIQIVMGLIALLIVVSPWIYFFNSAWLQLSLILEFLLVLYYRYRIRRHVVVNDTGVAEYVGHQEWEWNWEDIAEVRETVALQAGSLPSRRLVIEHHSTHDIAIDDQMDGYDAAVRLIETHWQALPGCRIERTNIPFILLRYW